MSVLAIHDGSIVTEVNSEAYPALNHLTETQLKDIQYGMTGVHLAALAFHFQGQIDILYPCEPLRSMMGIISWTDGEEFEYVWCSVSGPYEADNLQKDYAYKLKLTPHNSRFACSRTYTSDIAQTLRGVFERTGTFPIRVNMENSGF